MVVRRPKAEPGGAWGSSRNPNMHRLLGFYFNMLSGPMSKE